MRLTAEFYAENADTLAPKLLGKLLCRRIDGEILRMRITETECYLGENDTACHAHRGRTPRTATLYERGGIAYVYLCYGIHNLLNVVSGPEGYPQAVLIRGVEGYSGPGRLTRALSIDRSLNGADLTSPDSGLWLEDDGYSAEYERTPRIGIDYAAPADRDRLWRFLMKTRD